MAAALAFGAQAQAQTGTTTVPGTTNPKDAPSPPPTAGPSKRMAPGMGNAPMGQGMTAPGSTNAKDAAAMSPGGADQPVRQSGKVAKNKAERMEKGSNPKSPMNKSNAPVRESDLKDMPAK